MKQKINFIFLAFILGACGLAYEYSFSKLSSDLLGNSAKQWAIIIGVMMFCMGIGAEIQKLLSDEKLFDKFISLEIILGIVGGLGPLLLLKVFSVNRDYYILIQYLLTCSTGMIIGMEVPILARLNEKYSKSLKDNLGSILWGDYLGAFLGAFLWVYLLREMDNLLKITITLGLFNLLAASIAIFRLKRQCHYFYSLLSCVLLSIGVLTYFYYSAENLTRHLEQNLFRDPIIYSKNTPYQHIVMTQSARGDIVCYINGNIQFDSRDEHIYHETLIHPVMHLLPQARTALIMGGGDGLALRELLKYSQLQEIDLVDIDPQMIQLAKDNPYLSQLNQSSLKSAKVQILEKIKSLSPREEVDLFYQRQRSSETKTAHRSVYLYHLDATIFAREINKHYDVIILDFPDPNNKELGKLYSLNFYKSLKKLLYPKGLIVQQSTSAWHFKEAFLCIGRTWQAAAYAALPYHQFVPSFGDWGFYLVGDKTYYSKEDLKNKIMQLYNIKVKTTFVTPETIKKSLIFGLNELNSKQTSYNTIVNNNLYQFYQYSELINN